MSEPSAHVPLTRVQRILVGSIYLIVALLVFYWAFNAGRPMQLVEVSSGRVQCLSYSPPAVTPVHLAPTNAAQIRRDLKQLAGYTDCVRTYSVDNGLADVPVIARELGLKVLLGGWIGKDAIKNQQELEMLVQLANAHPDVVRAVIVGNEVLLRREQTPAALREYIRHVRSRVNVPVTYADVWEFWLEHRDVAQEVSFVTVHMLPYWEDHPIAIDGAVAHIVRVYGQVQKAFPDHRIVIGEAGWPSEGRQRAGAVPGLVNQARFFREFTLAAATNGFEYNLIEAFDQPWKRALEGTVGGAWGMFDADGQPKFGLTGPVIEEPRWRMLLMAALAGAVLGALYGWLRWRNAWTVVSLAAVAGYSAGALVLLQAWMLLEANRSAREWVGSALWAVSGWVVFVCGTCLLADRLLGRVAATHVAGAFSVSRTANDWMHRVLSIARLMFLFGASYMCLLLTLDPRYRDIPLVTMLLPVITLVVCSLVAARMDRSPRAAEEVVLACWLIVASGWIAIGEGLQNTRALAWCVLCLLLGGSVLWTERRSRERQRAQQQTHTGELDPV